MSKEELPKVGTIIETEDHVKLRVDSASYDGSGCRVCDNGKQKCYFSNKKNVKCPKCEIGGDIPPFYSPWQKVVFIEIAE